MLTVLLGAATPALTRDGAQQAARSELAKRPYQLAQPAWWTKPLSWVLRTIGKVWTNVADATGGSAALAVILLLLAVVVGLVLWRVGPARRSARRGELALTLDPETTSAGFRANAERFADGGHWAQAVRERLRAISRELEERALVEPRAGRTAYEVAIDGGRALPVQAAALREAADRFTSIWYGSVPATAEDYRRLTEIDSAVHRSRAQQSLAAP